MWHEAAQTGWGRAMAGGGCAAVENNGRHTLLQLQTDSQMSSNFACGSSSGQLQQQKSDVHQETPMLVIVVPNVMLPTRSAFHCSHRPGDEYGQGPPPGEYGQGPPRDDYGGYGGSYGQPPRREIERRPGDWDCEQCR